MQDISLLPKQNDFIFDRHAFACYAGGFGSGKTVAGCFKGLILSQLMPGNFGLVGRLTYPELRDTTRKTFMELVPPDWYDSKNGGSYKESENYLRLYNGSEVIFRHLDKVSQKEILSLNLGWFFIDQAEEISEEVYLTLLSRLRLNRVSGHYGFVVCNHEGHNWIWKRWVKEPNELLKVGKTPPEDRYLIEASSRENVHLPPDYIPRLEANYPADWVKRYVDGSWDVFMGQIFEEFNPAVHVIDPFEIPESWERIVGIDHGMVNPTAVLWAAIDYDENMYVFDEYYRPNDIVSTHAEAIWDKTGDQNINLWVIDPSTKNKTMVKNGMPWSVIEEYNDHGIYPIPANNEWLASINRLREYLKVDKNRINPITQEKGSPKIFVFKNCVNLIEELPSYKWKQVRQSVPVNAPEKPQKHFDHAIDALRYIVMSRPEATPRLPGRGHLAFLDRNVKSTSNAITQGKLDIDNFYTE